MKKILLGFIIILTLVSLWSCKNIENKNKGIDSLTFSFLPFDTINIYDVFNVYIKQDSVYSVKVVSSSDLLENVELIQKENILDIRDMNSFYFLKSYDLHIDLYISAPDLQTVNLFSASTVYSIDTLEYKRFMLRFYGYSGFSNVTVNCEDHFFLSLWNVTGDYTVSGKCTYFQVLNHGTSYIHAYNLLSQYCSIDQNSTGNIELTSIKTLNVIIRDIGNVYYKGDPVVDLDKLGSGTLYKIQ